MFAVMVSNDEALVVADWNAEADRLTVDYRIGDDFRSWSSHDLNDDGRLGAGDLGFTRSGNDLIFDLSSVADVPANPTVVWQDVGWADLLFG
jgi:hypothetical protein